MSPQLRRDRAKPEKARSELKAEERSRIRLDVPRELRPSLRARFLDRTPGVEQDRFGAFAEQFARFMGTARFLIWMTVVVVVWMGWNYLAPDGIRFDGYPFIFLTLVLSLQASYAAPLILLAQNRQELRDRVMTEQDRQANARAHADMEFLAREVASLRMALGEVATRDYLRSELRGLLTELEQRDSDTETEEAAEAEAEPGGEVRSAGPED